MFEYRETNEKLRIDSRINVRQNSEMVRLEMEFRNLYNTLRSLDFLSD